MNGKILLVVLVVLLIALSGCTSPPYICGNGICETDGGENQYNCPRDCGPPSDSGELEVEVVDANTRQPIENALVEAVYQEPGEAPVAKHPTDERGIVLFEGLPAGSYLVEASKQGYITNTVPVVIDVNQATKITVNLDKNLDGYCGDGNCGLNEDPFNCELDCEKVTYFSQGCKQLSVSECETYKLNYLKTVFQTYKEYHDAGDSLFLDYNHSVLQIIDNNDYCGSAVGLHGPQGNNYSFPRTVVGAGGGADTEFDRIREEFLRGHLIVDESVHGTQATRGIGLVYPEQEVQNTCTEVYTHLGEFLLFASENENPFLFERSSSCMESVIGHVELSSFCCWPQAEMLSGYWGLLHTGGNSEAERNSQKFISNSPTIGHAYLKTGGTEEAWVYGDITASLPFRERTADLECGFAEKKEIPCECPISTEGKVAVILKEGSTYDSPDLESTIQSFLNSVENDTGIQSAGIKRFNGIDFNEFDVFVEFINLSEDVNFFIFVGEDLPIFDVSGQNIGPSYGGSEYWTYLNFVGDLPPTRVDCADLVFSVIVPPFYSLDGLEFA
ncbi:MAG: carboxypeptidase regulatory-like domain-containing protein [Candidatus Diapherotrites archaeon]|uniref:Carboxypeptidase regulatory-like domain-containing protein n=1 Tax=Candidatus Iainarchaeum sp. TaxID=3101447 RepID=A0A938YXE8_9ARCH|nr:carboxypeptidase regulatory-like domain-containing protein [Candidatus Diapherotrites archaeon]